MKYALSLVALIILALPVSLQAGDPQQPVVLTEVVNASFGKVWDAIQASMNELGCGKPQTDKVTEPVEEAGFYKGVYVSDFCVISTGEDTTRDFMEKFGEIPRIRGGIWITGRVQYKINVKEEGIRQTKIILRAEISGFEEFITNGVHFWVSNGILEKQMMDAILAKTRTALEDQPPGETEQPKDGSGG